MGRMKILGCYTLGKRCKKLEYIFAYRNNY